MKSLMEARLYAFIDTAYCEHNKVGEIARQLCDGGADIIQLRAKGCTRLEIRRMAEKILPITTAAQVPLVINDFLDVAREVGTAYCHLGQEDFFASGRQQVSELIGASEKLRMGLSSHAPDQAVRAVQAGAAYLGAGPVFATPTKAEAKPVGLEYMGWMAANITMPWFAIGGINLDNLPAVLGAGARRVCVVSAILKAPHIRKACQAFKQQLI